MSEARSKAILTPYDKARMQMTPAEYKAWVEKGIWPKRIPYPVRKNA